ncbi:GroES-like protein [Astrocystis sublimbata]|nr:GroES-like protein [Astrocystis sublimbata]
MAAYDPDLPSSALPTTQTILVQAAVATKTPSGSGGNGPLALHIRRDGAIPPLPSPNHVLIRVLAVALNPTDHKMPTHFPMPGSTTGCDFCGIVVASSAETGLEVGTRVCGAVYAYNPEEPLTGAFAQYVVADSRLLLRVPVHWSDLRAAALGGIGWGTAGLTLWSALALAGRPSNPTAAPETPVLVYGGATATGTMACQILKLSGYRPIIAVTSKDSAPLAKRYGATDTVSYTSSTCKAAIADIMTNASPRPLSLRHVLDCITDPESAAVCFGSLSRAGGRYACLEDFDETWRTRRTVRTEVVMAFELWGSRVILDDSLGDEGGSSTADNISTRETHQAEENTGELRGKSAAASYSRPANPEKLQATIAWAREMQDLIDRDLIDSHPVQEIEGKWDGIVKGLLMLQRGEVRGCKLVVRISEA